MEESSSSLSLVSELGKDTVWEVHKFGGTSVANAECLLLVADIVEQQLELSDGDGDERNNNNNNHNHNHNNNKSLAVVVSAMGGKPKVTDLLLDSVTAAAARDNNQVETLMQLILDKHTDCLNQLSILPDSTRTKLQQIIYQDTMDIRDILKTVSLMKWKASRISELISGYGETWSSQILTALLSERQQKRQHQHESNNAQPPLLKFVYLDARRFITIDEDAIQDGAVCWDISYQKLQQVYDEEVEKLRTTNTNVESRVQFVITGYVASNTHGVATTLQRDGSDYSAAITGYLLKAKSISIWTDVDGVLSADPRRVPHAYVLPEVSYDEAMELAYFGAKVIHPKTMQPALMANPQIPIYIRNTFHASFRGSRIYTSGTSHTDRDRCVCGFASIEKMALINVEGSGMMGVKGVARRMFGTLESAGVNVVLISQASSEHSITFATTMEQAVIAKQAIEEEFHKERKQNHIDEIVFQAPCSIIAAVGDGMHTTTGVSGKFFSALGDAKINILAISQGSSERNISAVVLESESTRALRAVHAAFRLSTTTVRLGLVGMNDIGQSLIQLLQTQRDKIQSTFDIDLQLVAILPNTNTNTNNNTNTIISLQQQQQKQSNNNNNNNIADSLTMTSYDMLTQRDSSTVSFEKGSKDDIAQYESSSCDDDDNSGGLETFANVVNSEDCANVIIMDCTDDKQVGEKHVEWLQAGIHIVTANNSALSGSLETRQAIQTIVEKQKKANYCYEVTVGGGLPIISTLRDLLNSGDKIRHMDGILSVSMSYIMHRISPPPGLSHYQQFDQQLTKGHFQPNTTNNINDNNNNNNNDSPCSLSQALKEAIELGLTEQDPIRDFNNEYTARCLMVLARELGLDHMHTVQNIQQQSDKLMNDMTPLISSSSSSNNTTTNTTTTTVVDSSDCIISKEMDEMVAKRVAKAMANGCVLRHISSIDVKTGAIDIQILEVPQNHVFATSPPSSECVRFFTQRYRQYPLIVQGPSAGEDSTASALLAEVLHLMKNKLGGPRSGELSRTDSSTLLK